MKKAIMAAVVMFLACGARAVEFSELQAIKVPEAGLTPARVKAAAGKKLAVPETVEAVGITVVDTQDSYFTLRYVLEKYDIYPQLRVEIYQRGFEGDPTVINAVMDIYPGGAPVSDSQIEDVRWAAYALNFKLNGKSCVYDLGKDFSKVGRKFENAASLKYSCGAAAAKSAPAGS